MKKLMILFVILLAAINLYSANDPLAAYLKDGKWHFIDSKGKEMFKPLELESIGSFSEGLIGAKIKEDGKSYFAYLNTKGKVEFKTGGYHPLPIKEGYFVTVRFIDTATKDKLLGFMDRKGKTLFPPIFKDAQDFSEGLAYVMNDSIRGYINKKGELVISTPNTVGYNFVDGIAGVCKLPDYKFGFMDKKGNMIIPFKFDEVEDFSEGLCKVFIKGKYGYINKKGDVVVAARFDEGKPFKEKRAIVGMSKGLQDSTFNVIWGVIDTTGKQLETFIYSYADNYSDGLACVKKDSLYGFIDTDCNVAIDFKFKKAGSFAKGLAFAVDKDGIAGFIDKKGKFVITLPEFNFVLDMRTNKRYKP